MKASLSVQSSNDNLISIADSCLLYRAGSLLTAG